MAHNGLRDNRYAQSGRTMLSPTSLPMVGSGTACTGDPEAMSSTPGEGSCISSWTMSERSCSPLGRPRLFRVGIIATGTQRADCRRGGLCGSARGKECSVREGVKGVFGGYCAMVPSTQAHAVFRLETITVTPSAGGGRLSRSACVEIWMDVAMPKTLSTQASEFEFVWGVEPTATKIRNPHLRPMPKRRWGYFGVLQAEL